MCQPVDNRHCGEYIKVLAEEVIKQLIERGLTVGETKSVLCQGYSVIDTYELKPKRELKLNPVAGKEIGKRKDVKLENGKLQEVFPIEEASFYNSGSITPPRKLKIVYSKEDYI